MFSCTSNVSNQTFVFIPQTPICIIPQHFCQGQSVFHFSFPIHIKCTMLRVLHWSQKGAPEPLMIGHQTPDVELQRLPVFVCPPLWNMWFWLQNVLLLNNVSALELGTLHKDYFVPWCPHGKSLPHCTHTHTQGDDDISEATEPMSIKVLFSTLVVHCPTVLLVKQHN